MHLSNSESASTKSPRGDKNEAIQLLSDANKMLDTWIGRFELGCAYLEASRDRTSHPSISFAGCHRTGVLSRVLQSIMDFTIPRPGEPCSPYRATGLIDQNTRRRRPKSPT